jgi:glutamate/tyrosine decarboxylase-like PLP-dependent enzyme
MTGPGAAASGFEWPADEIRRVGHRVADLIADYLTDLPREAVFRPVPSPLADEMVAAPVPAHGDSADAILDRFAASVAPFAFGNGHPRFYGWVNSPPAIIGVMAEALAAAMNPSVAGGNHAAVWIERQVLQWFKHLFNFPMDSMGLLVSGGSAAALTALTVARHRACARMDWNVRTRGVQHDAIPRGARLVVYKGAEGHGCNQKAVELLGIGADNIRVIPHDRDLRMLSGELDRLIAQDIDAGDIPVAVVASAGTVNTGAIDPLGELALVCERHGVWLHVDAAYGGPAVMTGSCREALAPLALADSIALDPHKWMYVPVDAGVVLIRDAQVMREAFSLVPPYLRTDGNVRGVQGPTWFAEYGLEQTRPFRALKVWAALCYFGTDGYRELIEHDLALARHLAGRVRATEDFVLWEPTGLSIVCFRAMPPSTRNDTQAADQLNRRILEQVQLGGAGFLSGTVVDGRFWLRACIVNPRATTHDVDAVFDTVRATHAAMVRD